MPSKTLASLSPGEYGVIFDIALDSKIRRRLQDIGFIKGAHVDCLYISPLGDPVAYRIKGTTIALRHEEAVNILLE